MGTAVTLIVGSKSPSTESNPVASKAGSPSEGPASDAPVGAEKPPKVRFGPGDMVASIPDGASNIDLDSAPPLVAESDIKGQDLVIGATTGNPTLDTEDSELSLAPLPSGGPAPSEAHCAEQVQKNGAYTAELTRGARFCVQTTEGRTAFLRTVAAPTEGTVRLKVTVWDLPG
ncbi:hypothetical protein ACFWPU_42755 [Streptomyces sp. NPDC058471]|uniref:hypothetical protein n=1 Tax=Streptomyces sp. NPDC058471 TaxID=3346516 RepID=UPI003647DC1F